MPVHKSYKQGVMVGWRYGRTGKVYRNREDALKQAVAIRLSRERAKTT